MTFDDGINVGTCGFTGPPAGDVVEIAYYTFPEHEGRGYAQQAARALAAIARDAKPSVVVTAHTLPEDGPSCQVLRNCGFTLTGSRDHPEDGPIWVWTYAKSQKVRNLERDTRATLLVETGTEYTELRGVMIESEAVIHREADVVAGFGKEMTVRYSEGISSVEGDAAKALEAQATKRVAISFPPTHVRSWDHRKLGGTY